MLSAEEFKKSILMKAQNYVNGLESFSDDNLIVKITRNEIKKEMDRERLKSSLIDKVKKSFETSHCVVDDCGKDLCITIPADTFKKKVLTLNDLNGKEDIK